MAIDSSDRFIATEPIGVRGEAGEKKVWDAVRAAFAPRPESFGFWRYPVFSKVGQQFKEPDILVIDREFGLTVIEVKSINITNIESIQGHVWKYRDLYAAQGNPFDQARRQLQALLGHCDSQDRLFRNVPGRVLVALPLITEREWQERGFHLLPSSPPIIFKDDLPSEERLINRVRAAHVVAYAPPLDDEQWALLGHVIAGTPVLKKEPREADARPDSRRTAIAAVQEDFHELDLQQMRIGNRDPSRRAARPRHRGLGQDCAALPEGGAHAPPSPGLGHRCHLLHACLLRPDHPHPRPLAALLQRRRGELRPGHLEAEGAARVGRERPARTLHTALPEARDKAQGGRPTRRRTERTTGRGLRGTHGRNQDRALLRRRPH